MITNQENIKNLMLNEIKDFIYSKKDEGIYRKRTIFGIKITLKNKNHKNADIMTMRVIYIINMN
ncbi:hypothetical protein [Brachyspira aalborgi]|uniref:hypothetical protein n=1 Tax=Brachyspira aalborgi TaxID=29522 RepID=UPI0018F5B972|nr:hypothetical protein [Brachyspira aalborgi]